jgi:ABC-2 type transport system ATP-binding protein
MMHGFLGPNGAGKTTTLHILLGFIRPTSGSATINGKDCWCDGVAARSDVGYLVPSESLYPNMTGGAILDYLAHLGSRPPAHRRQILDALGLSSSDLERKMATYSKGMKQKLALTAAMQCAPPILILDEPTDGLDPLVQRAFEAQLTELNELGTTVLMSSHDLAEVERTCREVTIIRSGHIIARESIEQLRSLQHRQADILLEAPPPTPLELIPHVHLVARDGQRLVLQIDGPLAPFLAWLPTVGTVIDLSISRPTLEEIFLTYYDGDAGSSTTANAIASVEAPARL